MDAGWGYLYAALTMALLRRAWARHMDEQCRGTSPPPDGVECEREGRPSACPDCQAALAQTLEEADPPPSIPPSQDLSTPPLSDNAEAPPMLTQPIQYPAHIRELAVPNICDLCDPDARPTTTGSGPIAWHTYHGCPMCADHLASHLAGEHEERAMSIASIRYNGGDTK